MPGTLDIGALDTRALDTGGAVMGVGPLASFKLPRYLSEIVALLSLARCCLRTCIA